MQLVQIYMFKSFLFLLFAVIFTCGCSSSPTHIGEHWGPKGPNALGVVREKDAKISEAFVRNFMAHINSGNFDSSFALLDPKISKKISKNDFALAIRGLDKKYGAEKSFSQDKLQVAQVLGGLKYDEALTQDDFKYYQAISSQYISHRDIDLTYVFRLTKLENRDTISLLSLGVFDNHKPVFILHPLDPVVR